MIKIPTIGELFFLLDLQLSQNRLFQFQRQICTRKCTSPYADIKRDLEESTSAPLPHMPRHHRFFVEQLQIAPVDIPSSVKEGGPAQFLVFSHLATTAVPIFEEQKKETSWEHTTLREQYQQFLRQQSRSEENQAGLTTVLLFEEQFKRLGEQLEQSTKEEETKEKEKSSFASILDRIHQYQLEPIIGDFLLDLDQKDEKLGILCIASQHKEKEESGGEEEGTGAFLTHLFLQSTSDQDDISYELIPESNGYTQKLLSSKYSMISYDIIFRSQSFTRFMEGKIPMTTPLLMKRNHFKYNHNVCMEPSSIREAALLRRLHHPHLLQLLDVFVQPRLSLNEINDSVLIFPFFPNNLLTWRLSRPYISVYQFIRIARQLLEVLDYLHESAHGGKGSIIHRNLHPGIVWVSVKPRGERPISQFIQSQRQGVCKPLEITTEFEAWLCHDVRMDQELRKRFEEFDSDEEEVDIYLGGMHLSGFLPEHFDLWNAFFVPYVAEEQEQETQTNEEHPQSFKVEKQNIFLKTKFTAEQAKLGDFFGLGCIFYFLLTGELPSFITSYLDPKNEDQCNIPSIFNRRKSFIDDTKKTTNFNEDKLAFPPHQRSSLDSQIIAFVLKLLDCGSEKSSLIQYDLKAKDFLQDDMFRLPIHRVVKDEGKKKPLTKKKTSIKLPFHLSFPPFTDLLQIVQEVEKRRTKEIHEVLRTIPRIPKIQRQIGPLTKRPYLYTDEEWKILEEKWEQSASEATQFLFQLYDIANKQEREKKMSGHPQSLKYCFCMAMALFNMSNKTSIPDNYENPQLGFLSPLLLFTFACWTLSGKCSEYFWNGFQFNEFIGLFILKNSEKSLGTSEESKKETTTAIDRNLLHQLLCIEETKLVSALDFYLWSPVHNNLYCGRDPSTFQTKWSFGQIDNDELLMKLILNNIQKANIRLVVCDLNIFINNQTDINNIIPNESNAKVITLKWNDFIKLFFTRLYENGIQVALVSRYDPTNAIAITKEEMQQRLTTKKQPKNQYQKLLLWTSAVLRSALEHVGVSLRTMLTGTPTYSYFPATLTMSEANDFLFRAVRTTFQPSKEFSWIVRDIEETKHPLPPQLEVKTNTGEPIPELTFISFDPGQYLKLSQFVGPTGGNLVSLKLWLRFHSALREGKELQQAIGINEFETDKKEVRAYQSTIETQPEVIKQIWRIDKNVLPDVDLLRSSPNQEDKESKRKKEEAEQLDQKVNKDGLSYYIDSPLFNTLGIVPPSAVLNWKPGRFFKNTETFIPYVNNFLLHLGIAMLRYDELNHVSLTPQNVLLCSGDPGALGIAASHCFPTLNVSSPPFDKEHLQNYVQFKTFESIDFTCSPAI